MEVTTGKLTPPTFTHEGYRLSYSVPQDTLVVSISYDPACVEFYSHNFIVTWVGGLGVCTSSH